MSNGGGIPIQASDWNSIKNGEVVTSGTYEGCVLEGSTYYWLSHGESYWVLNEGEPGEGQVKFDEEVFFLCTNDYTYVSAYGGWTDSETRWQWGGAVGNSIYLYEIES